MNAKLNLRCLHWFILTAIQVGLAAGAAGQDGPAAASNGREYFVVWKHSLPGGHSTKVLMGARVSTNGAVLPPAYQVITTNLAKNTRPGVASFGGDFLVVWTDDRAGTNACDIYGARISEEGALLDPNGIPICTATNAQRSPQVAPCGGNCLVAWEDERDVLHSGNIYGARVSPAGAVLDPDGIPICAAPGSELAPVVAATTNCALVVWRDYRNYGLYGARVDASGTVLETNGFPVLSIPSMPYPYAVAACQTNFLVAMEQIGDPAPSYKLWGLRLNDAGVILGSPFPITNRYVFGGNFGLVGSGKEFLLASAGYTSGQQIISAVRVECDGSVLDPAPLVISAGTRSKQNACCTALGNGFLVAWEDGRHSTAANLLVDVYAARLSKDGNVLDPDGVWLTPPPRLDVALLDSTNPPILRLSFSGAPGAYYRIQASSNLLHWETLGTAIEGEGGQFQFSEACNACSQFYRITVP